MERSKFDSPVLTACYDLRDSTNKLRAQVDKLHDRVAKIKREVEFIKVNQQKQGKVINGKPVQGLRLVKTDKT